MNEVKILVVDLIHPQNSSYVKLERIPEFFWGRDVYKRHIILVCGNNNRHIEVRTLNGHEAQKQISKEIKAFEEDLYMASLL